MTEEKKEKVANEITASVGSGPAQGKSASVIYKLGTSLTEACELFGEDVVYNLYIGQATVRIQAGIRACLEKGVDPVAWAAMYKLGTKAPSITADPQAAADAAISRMTDEQRLELLEKMKRDLGL